MCTPNISRKRLFATPCPSCGLFALELTAKVWPSPGWRGTRLTHVRLHCKACAGTVPSERIPEYWAAELVGF